MGSSGAGTGAMWRLRRALTEGPRRAGNAMWPARSSLSSSVRARGHVLGTARSIASIPERTQLATQPRAVPLGMRLEESADSFNSGSVEFPPLHDHDACHGCKIEPFST